MKLEDLSKFKKILLVGYGIEGKSTKEFLTKTLPDIEVGTADQKDGPNYLDKQKEFDLAIRSPGVRKELITIPYTTATNIFFANTTKPVIGVTGTKGKSTTASLIHSILLEQGLKSKLVGNIGTPLLSTLLDESGTDYYVAELSSFQLDDLKYSPHISLVINIYPEHMDYHGDVETYWIAKSSIIKHSTNNDYYVYNHHFPTLCDWVHTTQAKAVEIVNKLPFVLDKNPLLGEHNLENIKSAVTVGEILGILPSTMQKAISNFQPLPHRLELVGTYKNITFYDDAISTTPQSTIHAIKALKKVGTILLGGTNRGYDFSDLVKTLEEFGVPNVVLFPDSGKKILELINSSNYKPNVLNTSSMAEAVAFTYKNSPKRSICLLSTASPSYSLWKNFEEKGSEFKKNVLQLSKKG